MRGQKPFVPLFDRGGTLPCKDELHGLLGLGGGRNNEFLVLFELLAPRLNVGNGVLECLGTIHATLLHEEGRTEFGNKFLLAITVRAEVARHVTIEARGVARGVDGLVEKGGIVFLHNVVLFHGRDGDAILGRGVESPIGEFYMQFASLTAIVAFHDLLSLLHGSKGRNRLFVLVTLGRNPLAVLLVEHSVVTEHGNEFLLLLDFTVNHLGLLGFGHFVEHHDIALATLLYTATEVGNLFPSEVVTLTAKEELIQQVIGFARDLGLRTFEATMPRSLPRNLALCELFKNTIGD